MASNFGSIFTYSGDPGAKGFYDLLDNYQNSLQCHKAILELFMDALKLSSIRYRTGSFPASPTIPAIPNNDSLNGLLEIIPQDLQDPLSQVMYEQYEVVGDTGSIGNNAWYLKTYKDAGTQAALQAAVDQVRAYHYANEYNQIQHDYAAKSWAGGIPSPIAITTPQNAPSKATVTTEIGTLSTWIDANDPQIVALTTLKPKTAVQILNDVYGTVPAANIPAIEYTKTLIKQIQIQGNIQVTGTGLFAKTAFFNTVQLGLKDATSIWQTNAELKKIADQINAKSPTDIRKNSATVYATFSRIIEIFEMALSDPGLVASAKAEILNILTTFNNNTPSNTNYLRDRLREACDNLKIALNPDPQTLNAWVAEINQAPPTTIHYSEIDGLVELAIDQIIKVPITYKSSQVSLFGFSNYDDISQKNTVVGFPSGTSASDSDVIIVTADAKENTANYYRPVIGVFTKDNSGNHETYLKFFNIHGIANGTFYFTDPINTQQVRQDFFPTSASGSALTFDFGQVSINGSQTVPAGGIDDLAAGTAYKTVSGGSTSKVNFYTAIRFLSKWKDLNGQRRFDVIYQTTFNAPSTITITTHLIWYISSGDLNRTDYVNDELCLWIWMAPKEIKRLYPQIPTLLGLPPSRNIENGGGKILLGNNIIKSKYISAEQFYIKGEGATAEVYVLTNTPNPNLPAQIDKVLERSSGTASSSSPLADQASQVLSALNFRYYRRVDPTTATVIKWLPSAYRPNTLADGIDITVPSPPLPANYTGAIAVNNPISFNLSQNLLFFKEYTRSDAPAGITLKNKGNDLFRTRGKRLAAGGVMAKLRNYISSSTKPGTGSSLSASQMSDWEMGQSDKAREAWQDIKQSKRDVLPTNQEWCHLLGHGDGGDERLGNFVSGSFHCNTEQLAMESKDRRKITQGAPKGTFTLRSTAYLFNDGENLLTENYLTNDKAYNQIKRVYASLSKPKAQPPAADKSGTILPFAAFLRYKMYINTSGSDSAGTPTRASFQKLFDHVFEGQSEFIDQHQFNIIKYSSWFCLAGVDALKTWYEEQTAVAVDGEAAK